MGIGQECVVTKPEVDQWYDLLIKQVQETKRLRLPHRNLHTLPEVRGLYVVCTAGYDRVFLTGNIPSTKSDRINSRFVWRALVFMCMICNTVAMD